VKHIAPAGVAGVLAGSALSYYIREHGAVIDLIVGLAFIWVAIRMVCEDVFRRQTAEAAGGDLLWSKQAKAVVGGGVGFLTGIIGLSRGYLLVPSFIYFLRSPMRIAIGSSVASLMWSALIGGMIKAIQSFCNIPAAVALGLGAAGEAITGARLVAQVRPATLEAILGFVFLYVALEYVLPYFGIYV